MYRIVSLAIVVASCVSASSIARGAWWDQQIPLVVQSDPATAASNHATISFDGSQNSPGWGTFFQNFTASPSVTAQAHAAGMKSMSYYEAFGQSMDVVTQLNASNQIVHHYWEWQNSTGGTIQWVGSESFFDDQAFAQPYTRTNARYGGSPMTYPDGTVATGYNGDAADPRNSRVYDAGCAKNILGQIGYDLNDVPAGAPHAGLIYDSATGGYAGLVSFSKDAACPAWSSLAHAATLMGCDKGMDAAWTDNWSDWDCFGSQPVKKAFGDWSVAGFRTYLSNNFTPAQLTALGVANVATFDVRTSLMATMTSMGGNSSDLDSPVWQDPRWLNQPLWQAYAIYQRQTGTAALTNYYNTVKSAAATAGKPDFMIAGNDIPAITFGMVRGNLDMVSTEVTFGWGLATGSRGLMPPPVGRAAPLYKLAVEHAKSPFVNAWLYNDGIPSLNHPNVARAAYYEMLATNTTPMLDPSNPRMAGTPQVNLEFASFLATVRPVLGARTAVADVGVYYSSSSVMSQMTPGGIVGFDSQPHQFALWGWATAADELHYQYRAVPEWKLSGDTLAGLRVLIIPESNVFAPADVAVLNTWVQGGGRLIVTGVSGQQQGEAGNFALNPGGYSLASLTGVADVGTAPARQLRTVGTGQVLYIRDNVGMSFYNVDTGRAAMLPQFQTDLTSVLGGSAALSLTPGAGVTSSVGLTMYEDTAAKRLFVDANNFAVDLTTDAIAPTSTLQFSVELPDWLRNVPLNISVLSPDPTAPGATFTMVGTDRAEVTLGSVEYYASVVLSPVPEPSILGLLGAGLGGLLVWFTVRRMHSVRDGVNGATSKQFSLVIR